MPILAVKIVYLVYVCVYINENLLGESSWCEGDEATVTDHCYCSEFETHWVRIIVTLCRTMTDAPSREIATNLAAWTTGNNRFPMGRYRILNCAC